MILISIYCFKYIIIDFENLTEHNDLTPFSPEYSCFLPIIARYPMKGSFHIPTHRRDDHRKVFEFFLLFLESKFISNGTARSQGLKGLRGSIKNFEIIFISVPILLKFAHNM